MRSVFLLSWRTGFAETNHLSLMKCVTWMYVRTVDLGTRDLNEHGSIWCLPADRASCDLRRHFCEWDDPTICVPSLVGQKNDCESKVEPKRTGRKCVYGLSTRKFSQQV
jgi:hypothetical protein